MKNNSNPPLPESIVMDIPQVELKYPVNVEIYSRPQITNPDDAYRMFMSVWNHDTISYREEFVMLHLNGAKRVLGYSRISSGGRSATIVEPAMIFQIALLSHADSIVLAHNHPSGNLKASTADIHLTGRLKEAGKLLGISVEDHLIITANDYLSMRGSNQF